MKPVEIFKLLGAIPPALAPFYREKLVAEMEAVGLDPQSGQYYTLAVMHDFDPQPVTAAMFAERNPYSSPGQYETIFDDLIAKRWLAPAGEDSYILTDAPRAALDAVQVPMLAELTRLEPLVEVDLERLRDLLGRLVEAALAAPEPADKATVEVNRASDPGDAGPLLLNILQYLADLNAFRDDAHLAAWRPLDVSGAAWEALTLIWRDEAHSADELADALANRRYDADAYAAILDDLAARGWITLTDGRAQITETGAAVRQQAEDDTDRVYFAIWSALSEDEQAELGALLEQLRDELKALQPQTTEAQEA